MANAPKQNQEPKDGDTDLNYANPVDATYNNPQDSYPDETGTDNSTSHEDETPKPAVKQRDASVAQSNNTTGYNTSANPVDASYAPSTYASMSKVEPTSKLADPKNPAEKTMNPELSNGPDNNEPDHNEISNRAFAKSIMPKSRASHRDVTPTQSAPVEHQHGLHSSMVAWSAIAAGTLISASISLVLLFLASAMGLASISPWSQMGASAQAFSMGAAIVLILMQCLSSGLGGYLTGRLRSKWINMMPDEVFFRDTAHGFLSWALATLLTAGFLASAATSAINTGAAAVTTGAAISMSDASSRNNVTPNPQTYFVDKLFRANQLNVTQAELRTQANGILLSALVNRSLPETDRAYLAQLVSWQTGLSISDAFLRVRDVITQIDTAELAARQNADVMRKAASSIALFTFLSLLMGAFVACIGSALGGHHRDKI